MSRSSFSAILVMVCLTFSVTLAGGDNSGIINSPHNLSSGSTARIKSTTESRICIFCHTPHHALRLSDPDYTGPLWGRLENLAQDYAPYASDTIAALPGQPQGPSRLCLSCHDGTIALGSPTAGFVRDTLGTLESYGPPQSPKKTAVIGKNLSDDHPISIEYGLKPDEFNNVDSLRMTKLRGGVRYVECTSCHDPHNDRYGNFLVMDTSQQHDKLCTTCHNKDGWTGSDHQTGGTRYSATVRTSVAADGCVSCHVPHGAQFGKYLLSLSGAGLDSNCATASCHNGVAPYSDIPTQFSRSYAHPLTADIANNQHQQTEDLPLTSDKKHVHCVDCHNPHQATWKDAPLDAAKAPAVNGLLKGVRGVSIGGVAINAPSYSIYEYQICFRCHSGSQADSFNNLSLKVQRVFASVDEGERFNTASAKSYHPVAGPRTGTGLSLLVTANTLSIYCSNCHQPHGSDRPHMLLQANPDTFPSGTQRGYDLCYSCHNENYLMDVTTNLGKLHKAHVFGQHDPAFVSVPPNPYKNYPAACSVCHDPHGVPNIAGRTTATNSLHLINFDLRYVGTDPDPSKIPYNGNPGNPSCSVALPGSNLPLACHPSGMANPTSYSVYPYTPPPL